MAGSTGSDGHFLARKACEERRKRSPDHGRKRERTTKLALFVCNSSQELQDVFVCVRGNVVQEKKR